MTRLELKRIRAQYLKFIDQLEPTHFCTFNFGYTVKPLNGLPRMTGACCRVERKALGRMFFKRPQEDRMIVIGFPEHLDTNAHWHCLAHVPLIIEDALTKRGPQIWESLVPRGQLYITSIEKEAEVASYCTKRLTLKGAVEHVFVYGPDKSHIKTSNCKTVK